MIYLSESAIQYAFMLCLEKERYIINIAMATKEKVEIWYSKFNKLIESNSGAVRKSISIRSGYGSIEFTNGSSLSMFCADESLSRGKRCHLLIVDEKIEKDIVDKVLRPHETLNYREMMLHKNIGDIILSFEKLRLDYPETEVIIKINNSTMKCKIGNASIYVSESCDIVNEFQKVSSIEFYSVDYSGSDRKKEV